MIQRDSGYGKGRGVQAASLDGGREGGFPVRRSSEQTRSWSAPIGTILVAGVRPQAQGETRFPVSESGRSRPMVVAGRPRKCGQSVAGCGRSRIWKQVFGPICI